MPFMNNNFPIYSAIRRTIFFYGKNSDETFFLINDRSFACEKLRKGTRRAVTQRYLIAPSILLRNAGKFLSFGTITSIKSFAALLYCAAF